MSSMGVVDRINTLIDGLSRQGAVLRALILRELQSRFGRNNIGFLWVIVEPMLFATVITVLHTMTRYARHAPGISPFTFTLTGYTLFIIFRNTYNRAETAIHSSEGMLYHGMITPLDIMLSKAIVETLACLSALLILQSVGIMLGLSTFPARPLYLFAAIALIAWWSFALSLIVASYTYDNHVLSRLVHPSSYFAVPLSGAFVTMSFLPRWAYEAMSWNPMMIMFETARYGQFFASPPDFIYLGYAVAVCAGLTYWGLIAIRRVREKIHVN